MKKNTAPITVITALYNAEKYIEDTINSVANGTLIPDAHLIIDDGSIDNSIKIVENLSLKYPYIKIIKHIHNKGFPSALNTGIKASTTDYIAILDSDDIAHKYWLESTLTALKSNDKIASVGGGCEIMTEDGIKTGYITHCNNYGDVTNIIQNGGYSILHSGVMHKKSYLEEVGLYSTEIKSGEDNDIYLSLSQLGIIWHTGIPLIYCRQLRSSESKKTAEYTIALNNYLSKKRELLKSGLNSTDCKQYLIEEINALKSIKRLRDANKGEYEFRIGLAFSNGNNKPQALKYFILSIIKGYELIGNIKQIIKLFI